MTDSTGDKEREKMIREEAIEQLEKAYKECIDLGQTCGKDSVFWKRAEAIKAGLISLKVDEIADGYISKSVIEDIKAEIYKILDECEPACETQNNFDGGLTVALEIIDKHMSGKEQE